MSCYSQSIFCVQALKATQWLEYTDATGSTVLRSRQRSQCWDRQQRKRQLGRCFHDRHRKTHWPKSQVRQLDKADPEPAEAGGRTDRTAAGQTAGQPDKVIPINLVIQWFIEVWWRKRRDTTRIIFTNIKQLVMEKFKSLTDTLTGTQTITAAH